MTKWVYSFGDGKAEGEAGAKNLLGGKGANLAEMSALGLPVPPGFTITTQVCTHYYANGKSYPAELQAEVEAALAEVGRITGRRFGDPDNLLLVSVRSGARASMPGMEALAPERTETSSRLAGSPKRLPVMRPTWASAASTSAVSSAG